MAKCAQHKRACCLSLLVYTCETNKCRTGTSTGAGIMIVHASAQALCLDAISSLSWLLRPLHPSGRPQDVTAVVESWGGAGLFFCKMSPVLVMKANLSCESVFCCLPRCTTLHEQPGKRMEACTIEAHLEQIIVSPAPRTSLPVKRPTTCIQGIYLLYERAHRRTIVHCAAPNSQISCSSRLIFGYI